MDSSLFDVALLLGIKSVTTSLKSSIHDSFFEALYNNQTRFVKKLPQLLCEANRDLGIDVLSKSLFVSQFFIKLINPSHDRCGRCIMCDKHYSNIKIHLKQGHLVGKESVYVYASIFGEESYYYMPMENRKVEEFPDDSSRIKKVLDKAPEDQMRLNSNIDLYKENFKHKKLSRIELSNSNCLICGECGKIITKSSKYVHLRNHKKTDPMNCTICGKKIKKKDAAQHSKICGVHIPP